MRKKTQRQDGLHFEVVALINETKNSRVLLARELKTRRLAIVKRAVLTNPQGDALSKKDHRDNQRAIQSEVDTWQALSGHYIAALPELFHVTADAYIAPDVDTGANYLAEPYYAGYTVADLVSSHRFVTKFYVFCLRHLNTGLLRAVSYLFKTPRHRNMLRILRVPDRILIPSSEIREGNPLPVQQAVAIALEIADFLICVHREGYIHLDLKPSNIMFRTIQWPGRIGGAANRANRAACGGHRRNRPRRRLTFQWIFSRWPPSLVIYSLASTPKMCQGELLSPTTQG